MQVITSIIDGKDDIFSQPKSKAKYIAYTDQEGDWEIRKPYNRFKSPRRNSRVPKMLIHQFSNDEVTLWIDGNIELLKDPMELLPLLGDADMMVFSHPDRDCLYDEAKICAINRLDDPEIIIEQVKKYEDEGFGKHRGLAECNFILRRNNERTRAFNNTWFSEYCRHSCRDQIAFMYAVNESGVKVKYVKLPYTTIIPGKVLERGDIFRLSTHLTPRDDEEN